jgi:ribonuclease PH
MEEQKQLPKWPLRGLVSAVSVGVVGGTPMVDLDYSEDSSAEVDLSVVCAADGRLIEVQGGAEKRPFAMDQFQQMLALGQTGCATVVDLQKKALGI